ncbi:MAG: hypothetical protein Q4G58_15360 [bacterium]|nr:hypothetical protein [bacterium]
MNGKDLLEGLSFIEEELIQEAEQKPLKIKRMPMKRVFLMAASLAAIITTVVVVENHSSNMPHIAADPNVYLVVSEKPENDGKHYTLQFNTVDSFNAPKVYIEGYFQEHLSTKQGKLLLPIISKKYSIDGSLNYSKSNGKIGLYSIDTDVEIGKEETMRITISPNEIVKDYVIEGKTLVSEIEGVSIEAGVFKTSNNSKEERTYSYYADFKLDEVAYYVEFTGKKEDEELFTNMIADIILGGKADLSVFEKK